MVKRANDGHGSPLSAIGHDGEVSANPVCHELLVWLGQTRTGNQVRTSFQSPPFGWPRATVHGALLALVFDGRVRAAHLGKPRGAKELTHPQIGQTEFVRENQPLTDLERIALAAVLKETVGATSSADIAAAVPNLLERLTALAHNAGGPAPLPPQSIPPLLHELRSLGGVALLRNAYEAREALTASVTEWTDLPAKAANRMPKWDRLQELLEQAPELPAIAEVRAQAGAIHAGRTLLLDPDPVGPLIQAASDALRAELTDARERQLAEREQQVAALAGTPEWTRLSDAEWKGLLAAQGLGPVPTIEVGTEELLLKALHQRPLSTWQAEIDALPTRMQHAHAEAVKLLTPKAVPVAVKYATLATPEEIDAYLAELRERLLAKIASGVPVYVQGGTER